MLNQAEATNERGNFWTAVSFEVRRTLRRPGFWLGTLLIPLVIVVAVWAQSASMETANTRSDGQSQASFDFEYVDDSGWLDPELMASAGGTEITDPAQGVAAVQAGQIDAFFEYPADLTTAPILIAGQDVGVFESERYASVAQNLLDLSLAAEVGNPELVQLLVNSAQTETTTYRDGVVSGGVGEMVVLLLLAAVFLLPILLLSNQMVTTFLDEKENRVAEMLLTSVKPVTLVLSKLVSLIVLGVIQMVILLVPTLVVLTQTDTLNIDLGGAALDWPRISVGLVIALSGLLFYTTSVMLVGLIAPTIKDASPLLTPVLLVTIIPIYIALLMMSSPDSPIVQVSTFFPWTAALTALIRNAFDNLPLWQGIVVIVELWVVTAALIALGARIARAGLLSYSQRLNLKRVLQRPRV
ncbi:MAG: ABC transporter permease [Propionibacteriaceae bacterium]|jgi:ABC-2 type transport system permease protein|nr:ABC transporter permease [Propionibacteriaceae bacterium]